MPLILPPKSKKMHLRGYAFSKFPGVHAPRIPKGTLEWALDPNTHLSLLDSCLLKTLATSLLSCKKEAEKLEGVMKVKLGIWR